MFGRREGGGSVKLGERLFISGLNLTSWLDGVESGVRSRPKGETLVEAAAKTGMANEAL